LYYPDKITCSVHYEFGHPSQRILHLGQVPFRRVVHGYRCPQGIGDCGEHPLGIPGILCPIAVAVCASQRMTTGIELPCGLLSAVIQLVGQAVIPVAVPGIEGIHLAAHFVQMTIFGHEINILKVIVEEKRPRL